MTMQGMKFRKSSGTVGSGQSSELQGRLTEGATKAGGKKKTSEFGSGKSAGKTGPRRRVD